MIEIDIKDNDNKDCAEEFSTNRKRTFEKLLKQSIENLTAQKLLGDVKVCFTYNCYTYMFCHAKSKEETGKAYVDKAIMLNEKKFKLYLHS